MKTKTDARNIATTYTYDALNRLTGKTYSDGTPAVSYAYDTYQTGSLASSSQGGVAQYYPGRDVMGRPLQSQVLINGQTYSFSYVYDLSGALTSETYPSGRVIRTTYDGAGRTSAVSGTLGTQQTNYVGSVQYWPHGAPQVYQYGNNVWPVNSFDKVLRPQETYSTIANNSSYWLLYITNAWNTNGTLNSLWEGYGPAVTWSNMIWYNGSFGYDRVNRLTSAGDAGWSRAFSYDQYGNMSVTSSSNVPLNGLTPQILRAPYNPYNPANNRLLEGGYDAAGNMGTVGALSFWYDAEGRQTQSYDAGSHTTANYTYDADGQRVQKAVSNGPTTVYIHDAFGQLAAEYASSAPTPPCTTCYLSYDYLGSVRLITDQNANVVSRHDYLPFGEEIPNGSGGRSGNGFGAFSNVNQMFTGQERDGEMVPNFDYFGARYYGGVLGRWPSPDPAFESEILELPQTWNRYSYVHSSPFRITDPDGRCPPCIGAVVGGIVEGGWNLGTQLYQNGGDIGGVSWTEVGANAAGGAITGAIAGATGGGSLLADALWGASANVAGGIVTRTAEGEDANEVFSASDIAEDAVSGLVGGGAGHVAANVVHVPEEPAPPGSRRHAVGRRKLSKYDAAVAARNRAMGLQVGIGTAVASPPTHSTAGFINNFWNILNWLIFTPENRTQPKKEPQEVVTSHVCTPDQPCSSR